MIVVKIAGAYLMDNDKFGRSNNQDFISDFKTPAAPATVTQPQSQQPRPVDRASQVQDYAAMKAQAEQEARGDDVLGVMPVPAQADSEISDQLDSIDIVNEDSTPMPKPFVSTGKSRHSKKLVIWLIVSALVLLLGAAGYIYWSRYYHKTSDSGTKAAATAVQLPTTADAATVLKSIDNNYGDYKVLPEKFADKTNYPSQYVTYDSDGRYYIRTPETWNYYNLGDSPGCDGTAFKAKYGTFFDFTQQAFQTAGFEISNPKSGADLSRGIYAQYNDCGSSLVAKSATETCSVYLREAGDVNPADPTSVNPKAVGSVACSALESVKPEITKIEQVNQVLSSSGSTSKFNALSLNSISYYKDSLTTGYKIAAFSLNDASDIPQFYYQKGTENWVVANQPEMALNCDTDNADLKAAFKGEACTVKDALSGDYLKSVF